MKSAHHLFSNAAHSMIDGQTDRQTDRTITEAEVASGVGAVGQPPPGGHFSAKCLSTNIFNIVRL